MTGTITSVSAQREAGPARQSGLGHRRLRRHRAGDRPARQASAPQPSPTAHFIVSDDVERSRRLYTEVLGGRVEQHQYEIRCYIRDSDGYIIEVGQTTDPGGDWSPAHWPSSTPLTSPSEC